jgi:hypothetical protein
MTTVVPSGITMLPRANSNVSGTDSKADSRIQHQWEDEMGATSDQLFFVTSYRYVKSVRGRFDQSPHRYPLSIDFGHCKYDAPLSKV